jgi:hypothetical protein
LGAGERPPGVEGPKKKEREETQLGGISVCVCLSPGEELTLEVEDRVDRPSPQELLDLRGGGGEGEGPSESVCRGGFPRRPCQEERRRGGGGRRGGGTAQLNRMVRNPMPRKRFSQPIAAWGQGQG